MMHKCIKQYVYEVYEHFIFCENMSKLKIFLTSIVEN